MMTKLIYMAVALCITHTSMYADIMEDMEREVNMGNYSKAVELAEFSCEEGDGRGCGIAGGIYQMGLGMQKNNSKAFEFLNKACELKNESGCLSVGRMHQDGEGTKRNIDKAKQFYQKACDMDSSGGCVALGFMYVTASSVKLSYPKGNAYFEKACRLNRDSDSGMGCLMMARAYGSNNMGVKKNHNKALKLAKQACDLGTELACTN